MAKVRKKIGNIPINTIKQDLQSTVDASVVKMQQDVTDFIEEETAQYPEIYGAFKFVEDSKGRHEVTTDSESRIVSYRKEDGTKVENIGFESPKIATDNLNLSESGMTEFQQALKNHGFKPGGGGDFTDKSSMQIPMPRLAFVNITAPNGNAIWPTSKTNDYHYYMEFYDGVGNYFRKEIIFNAQGRSSMNFVKKNGAVDICNNNSWDDKDTFSIKFGNWVSQDSFHFKSYYNDFFRGIGVVGYKIYELILEKENIQSNKPWKKELLKAFAAGYDTSTYKGVDDMSIQMDNGAKCFPDGFPAIFYLNGEFYGVYSWQLKKHRDNYHLNKDNGNHIHLDGNINWDTLFGANGDSSKINWNPDSWAGFEIRNPKNLYTTTGDKYNAELNKRQEIANEEIVNSWIESGQLPDGTTITNKIKKALNNSKDVYNSIVSLSTYCQTIIDMDKNNVSTDEIKNYFEEHFDVDNIIDYIIFSSITYNWDGFGSNWQWFTYDGVKWYVTPYDLDNIFGAFVQGNFILNINPSIFGISNTITLPPSVIGKYYIPELKTKWDSVKDILNPNNTILLVKDWMDRIGQYYYEEEYKKWKNTPPNRDSNVNSEFWVFTNEYVSSSVDTGNYTYDEEKNYHAFDGNERADNTCWFSSKWFKYKFRCVKANIGQKPVLDKDRYLDSTEILGFHDSIWRIYATMNHIYSGLNNIINNL